MWGRGSQTRRGDTGQTVARWSPLVPITSSLDSPVRSVVCVRCKPMQMVTVMVEVRGQCAPVQWSALGTVSTSSGR